MFKVDGIIKTIGRLTMFMGLSEDDIGGSNASIS